MNEMYNNGMKISNACYYSGINRITYYYRKKHENKEDKRYSTRIDSSFREYYKSFLKNLKDGYRRRKSNYNRRSMINVS